MRIDIATVEGNTTNALTIASRFLMEAGAAPGYILDMKRDVFNAQSAEAARRVIEERTGGGVSFFNSACGG